MIIPVRLAVRLAWWCGLWWIAIMPVFFPLSLIGVADAEWVDDGVAAYELGFWIACIFVGWPLLVWPYARAWVAAAKVLLKWGGPIEAVDGGRWTFDEAAVWRE